MVEWSNSSSFSLDLFGLIMFINLPLRKASVLSTLETFFESRNFNLGRLKRTKYLKYQKKKKQLLPFTSFVISIGLLFVNDIYVFLLVRSKYQQRSLQMWYRVLDFTWNFRYFVYYLNFYFYRVLYKYTLLISISTNCTWELKQKDKLVPSLRKKISSSISSTKRLRHLFPPPL